MSFLGWMIGSSIGSNLDVDVQTAHTMLQAGALLLDVREPAEFTDGHASGARSIPLGQLADRAGELQQDARCCSSAVPDRARC